MDSMNFFFSAHLKIFFRFSRSMGCYSLCFSSGVDGSDTKGIHSTADACMMVLTGRTALKISLTGNHFCRRECSHFAGNIVRT